MTVKEIKAKLPEAEVYSFDPNAHHMILVDSRKVLPSTLEAVAQGLRECCDIKFVILYLPANLTDAIRLLEVKE